MNRNINERRYLLWDTRLEMWKARKRSKKLEWWIWWSHDAIAFGSRNAALMWLKRYAKENISYMMNDKEVRVINGTVYFYNSDFGFGICAEPKRMCVYGQRNN